MNHPQAFLPNRPRRRWVAALVCAALVLAACGGDDSKDESSGTTAAASFDCPTKGTGDAVKIGVVWPEGATVNIPELGKAATAAAQYGSDCLGGIGGRPIDLVTCKIDETNPASGTGCANQMVEAKVAAVVVTITSQGATLVPIITGAGIPYVVSGGSSPQESIDKTGLVFGVSSGVGGVLGAMAQTAADEKVGKVTLLVSENAATGVSGLANLPFGKAGVKVNTVAIPAGTPDMTSQLSAALSDGAEATAVIGDATLCISYLQAALSVDPTGKHWIIGTCTDASVASAVGADGLDGATVFGASDVNGSDDDAVLYRGVMAKYAKGTAIEGFAVTGYVAMLSLVRGVKGLTGDVTAASIASSLQASKDIPLPVGAGATFGCSSDPIPMFSAICSSNATVAKVDGTKLTDIKVVDVAPLYAS
jgi:branched-chain amino acid transport system substrate-binding protein